MRGTARSRWPYWVFAAVAVTAASWLSFELVLARLPLPDTSRAQTVSPAVLAEDGRVLRFYLAADGRWRLPIDARDLPAQFRDLLLAYEDKRFYSHRGVDPLATLRAAYQYLREGRIVSGASTITMQTVRLLDGRRGGLATKIRQALMAIKLERQFDKSQILSLYLTVAPYGGNIEGVRAASLHYFGKEPKTLTVAEAAYLVVLPQSPERRRPGARNGTGKQARDALLTRMLAKGVLAAKDVATAKMASLPKMRGRYPLRAAHLSDRLRKATPAASSIATLIDYALQARLESLAAEIVAQQRDSTNAALLVIRNQDMAVRGYVGGGAYFDLARAGMCDLVRGVRSPGSTLKPLIYGLAFEDLIVHPNTIVSDDILRIDGYAPTNFDNTYRGEMTAREALIQSINTIAVALLNEVGPDRLLAKLRGAGVSLDMPKDDTQASLAIALGGVGISLENLSLLYTGLANGGMVRQPRFRPEDPGGAVRPLLSRDAAWAVSDSLADSAPPPGRASPLAKDGGRRVAFKTGTSFGFRDAWAVGFDSNYTVGVWLGRPDGSGRLGDTGAKTAVPIMLRIFDVLANAEHDVAADRPKQSILAARNDLPLRLRRFVQGNRSEQPFNRERPLEIEFPPNGTTVKLEQRDGAYLPINVVAVGGRGPFRWYVGKQTIADAQGAERLTWTPEGRGQTEFTVIDADGRVAKSGAWLE